LITGALSNALKGIGGEFELNRLVGAFGGVVYILAGPAFQAWNIANGHAFDVTAFCLAYSGGIAAITTGTAVAVAHKDQKVASAKVIEQTGAVPTPAKDGARVPTGEPPPVDKPADEAAGLPDTLR
jgi:hypothetical protein